MTTKKINNKQKVKKLIFKQVPISRRRFIQGTASLLFAASGINLEAGESLFSSSIPKSMPSPSVRAPLSNSLIELQLSYDHLIIGSGYGGSILAARLSKQLKSVCLLERGKEWLPGQFPDNLTHVTREFRSSYNELGLYDLYRNPDINILVGQGLGGTSLINSGVLFVPQAELFSQYPWPEEIRRDVENGILTRYFSQVKVNLQGNIYPQDTNRFQPIPKVTALQQGSNVPHSFVDVAVNFNHDGHADHDTPYGSRVPQNPCILCGDCVTGCNQGAKNTLDTNYLRVAKDQGAQIFTRMEVISVSLSNFHSSPYRYHVHYQAFSPEGKVIQQGMIQTKNLFLCAGSLGSSRILLQTAQEQTELQFSPLLGKRFSSNGDVLGIGLNGKLKTDAQSPSRWVGSTIMSTLYYNYNSTSPFRERFLIEDGAIPQALLPLMKLLMGPGPLFSWRTLGRLRPLTEAINHSLVYLGIGHDSSGGQIELVDQGRGKRANIKVSWPGIKDEPEMQRIAEAMKQHNETLDGSFRLNPLGQSTVHPLGGCPMASNWREGVVDHRGRVFNPRGTESESEVHPGLFVIDGSMIPTSIGVNPLMTIAALTERAADLFLQEQLSRSVSWS